MGSPFQDQMNADQAVFFNTDEFAVDGFYNGGADPIPVILEYGDGKTGRNAVGAVASVQKSDVPDPQYRQIIKIDGVDWTIDRAKGGAGFDEDEFAWNLPVVRDQKVSPWQK